MSSETENGQDNSQPGTDDRPLANLQAEMDRKFENQNAQLSAVLEKLNAVTEKSAAPAAPSKPESRLEDLMYEDPRAFADKIREEIRQEMSSEIQGIEQKQQEQVRLQQEYQKTGMKLTAEFPELSDASSPLHKAALRELETSGMDMNDPKSMERAAYKVAAEMGVKPMSKREINDSVEITEDMGQNFGFSGSGNRAPRQPSQRNQKTNDISEAWATLMEDALGVEIDRDRVAERAERRRQKGQSWKKYLTDLPKKKERR